MSTIKQLPEPLWPGASEIVPQNDVLLLNLAVPVVKFIEASGSVPIPIRFKNLAVLQVRLIVASGVTPIPIRLLNFAVPVTRLIEASGSAQIPIFPLNFAEPVLRVAVEDIEYPPILTRPPVPTSICALEILQLNEISNKIITNCKGGGDFVFHCVRI